jgi:DNA recombination protein Rad52
MPFTDAMNAELAKKLDPANVRPAAKFGPKGDYIEGWHAIAEANRIFGFDGWARETVHVERVSQYERPVGRDQKPGWSVTYIAKVRITAHGVVREGSGSGHGIGLDLGEAHESAIKEAETDAMKRALMTFGNPFGLALYDKSRASVGVDEAPAEPTESSLRYMDQCRQMIAGFPDRAKAADWWKQDAQKRSRANLLNQAQVDELKALIARVPESETA